MPCTAALHSEQASSICIALQNLSSSDTELMASKSKEKALSDERNLAKEVSIPALIWLSLEGLHSALAQSPLQPCEHSWQLQHQLPASA